MAFPGAKVHRASRRSFARGQGPTAPQASLTITDSGSVATMTFNVPVVVSGVIPMTVSGGLTFVSQTVVSPTVVTQTWSGALSTKTYTVPSNPSQVRTYQGGGLAPASGTFS